MTTVNGDLCGSREMFSRTESLIGNTGYEILRTIPIIIFGVGGVGSWCAEALVRSGAASLTIVDDDVVAWSNINRQGEALSGNVGLPKVEEMARRLRDINPRADIRALQKRFTEENSGDFNLSDYKVVIDAIDSVSCKGSLLLAATSVGGVRVYSSMGAARKIDPTRVAVAEFRQVKGCKLARALRDYFKRIDKWPRRKVKCVYSDEPSPVTATPPVKGMPNGSMMPVTATFGLTLAALVIKDIINVIR